MFIIFSVFYILIAAAMIVLILMQRGQGASAGASFGGGGSGTVFGASGSASFLSRATGILAALFFVLSLGMAVYLAHSGAPQPVSDLGVMSGVATGAPADTAEQGKAPAASQPADDVPAATQPAGDVPAAQGASQDQAAGSDVPAATAPSTTTGKDTGQPEPTKN